MRRTGEPSTLDRRREDATGGGSGGTVAAGSGGRTVTALGKKQRSRTDSSDPRLFPVNAALREKDTPVQSSPSHTRSQANDSEQTRTLRTGGSRRRGRGYGDRREECMGPDRSNGVESHEKIFQGTKTHIQSIKLDMKTIYQASQLAAGSADDTLRNFK